MTGRAGEEAVRDVIRDGPKQPTVDAIQAAMDDWRRELDLAEDGPTMAEAVLLGLLDRGYIVITEPEFQAMLSAYVERVAIRGRA